MQRIALSLILITLLSACSSKGVVDYYAGSTAQRLVTYSIDKLTRQLPENDFSRFTGQNGYYRSHFIDSAGIRLYADDRLMLALRENHGVQWVGSPEEADFVFDIYWTSLATNQDVFGLTIPLGYVPGIAPETRIDLFALDMFHGISEAYYFLDDKSGKAPRKSSVQQAVVRTDSLSLPFISIPINTLPKEDAEED